MSDTQQSLSKLRENYEKIRNSMESHDLNDIILDASDELFSGLKEIVFSQKEKTNIQNDIRRITRNIEEKYKKLEKDNRKYIQEISDLENEKKKKETDKQEKDDKHTANKEKIEKLGKEISNQENKGKKNENEIEKKKREKKAKEKEIDDEESQREELNNKINDTMKEKDEIIKEIKNKKNEKDIAKDPKEKDKIQQEIDELEKKKKEKEQKIEDTKKTRETTKENIEKSKKERKNIIRDIRDKNDENSYTHTKKRALENEKNIITNKNDNLEREIKSIEAELIALDKKIKETKGKQEENKDNMDSLKKVLDTHEAIANITDMFDTDKGLKKQAIKIKTTGTVATIQEFVKNTNNRPTNLTFEFYDSENKKINGNIIKKIKLKSGIIVDITGITINDAGEISWDNVKVTESETGKKVGEYPIEFEIEIGAKTTFTGSLQENVPERNINITNKKILKVEIDTEYLDRTKRQTEVNAYNDTPLGNGRVIEQRMDSIYNYKRARMEREAFFRALKKGDGPKLDNLNEDQKEDLYQRVRNIYRMPDQTPNSAILSAAAVAGLTDINEFRGTNGFLERFTSDTHESVKDKKNLINERIYRDYLNNNLDEQIGKYFERRFDNIFTDDLETNTFLKAQVTNYMREIDHNKVDNDMHMGVDEDIHTTRYGTDRMTNRRRRILGLRIGRRDVNYMRFFSGTKKSISEQTVNISTNTNPEDLNNPEPEKYSLDLEVSGKNHFRVNIKVNGQEEFALKNGDPANLVRDVLRCPRISHGKTRAHIGYNIIKGIIDMAKEKHISLLYRDPQTNHNMVIRTHEKNIIVEDQDETTNYGGNNRRITQVLFDYKLFENTNTFEGGTNRSLRRGIDALMGHFNSAMNQLHKQYTLSTEKKWRTKTNLPTSFFTSPIKKLLNLRTTTKFDFETSVTGANGKQVSISFKKNIFTISGAGLKKPISSRSLGKLLEKRIGKMRIFDGVERDICGKVYESLINNMRKNTKISRSNFGVKDPMTGRVYVIDEDGEFGYIQAESVQYKNPIRKMNEAKIAGKAALTGALLAGASATGGVAALAAPLTMNGIATTALAGAATGSAIDLSTYLRRNANRNRGIVPVPPPGRIMCNEREKQELLKNPFLMSGIIRAMSERLGRL